MAREWKPTKYDEDGQPTAYGYVEDGVDNPNYVQVGDTWTEKASLPKASSGARLVPYTGQSIGNWWWNTGQEGNTTLKAYSPSGGVTRLVQGPDGSPMVELPSDWVAGGHVTDSGPGWMDKLVQAAATSAITGGLASGFGLGSLAGGVDIGAGLDTSGFSAYDAGAFNAGDSVWSELLDPVIQSTRGTGTTLADTVTESGSTIADTSNGWDFPVDNTMEGTTIKASTLPADFGDVALPAGTTAPTGTFGGNVYGDPLTIVKQIANGTLPLSSLFGGEGTGGGTSAFGTGQPNYGNALAALFGYMGNKEMADKLLEATRAASDKADPFAAQRPYYQSALKNMYDNPSQMMNNSLFSGIRDQAMNATQRALSAKGYSGSGNEALGMMQAGTQAQTQFAMPYLQQLATNAGAGFGPGQAGSIYQQGETQAAQAKNNSYGNIGYGINQAIGNRSPLEDLFGRITSNGGQGNTGGNSGSGINIRIA